MGKTVREAREDYFATNGFDEAGYQDRWVRLPVGPLAVYMPNIAARRITIPRHDLHHLATGYGTDYVGEFEQSAWELGSGCGRFWFAWMINSQGILAGGLVAPRRSVRAYARGRRCKNTYDGGAIDDALLDQPVEQLRRQLGTDAAPPAVTWGDRLRFAGLWLAAASAHLLVLAVPVVAGYLILQATC